MQDKRSRWARHVRAWQAGELSQSAYCQAHGLSLASFGYWRAKLRADDADRESTSLVPIRVMPGAVSCGVDVCLRNGIVVRLSGPVDASRLAAMVQALSAC